MYFAKSLKALIRRDLITHRAILVLVPLPLFLSELGILILILFFGYLLVGLMVRHLFNQGVRRTNELAEFYQYCATLHFCEYLWSGFEKGTFVDDH